MFFKKFWEERLILIQKENERFCFSRERNSKEKSFRKNRNISVGFFPCISAAFTLGTFPGSILGGDGKPGTCWVCGGCPRPPHSGHGALLQIHSWKLGDTGTQGQSRISRGFSAPKSLDRSRAPKCWTLPSRTWLGPSESCHLCLALWSVAGKEV